MATGEVYLGLTLCTFDENGKLISKKGIQADPSKPMVALTFDDGPGPRTSELLAQLEKYNAHATFFMLGQKVPSYPDVIKKMNQSAVSLAIILTTMQIFPNWILPVSSRKCPEPTMASAISQAPGPP